MKTVHNFFVLLFVVLVFLVPSRANAMGLEVAVGYWAQDPSGDLSFKEVSPSDSLDLEKDLGYDKKNKPFARAKIGLPAFLPNVYLMATPMKFDGDSTIGRSFTFGDQTFNGSLPISSELTLNHYDIGLYYSLLDTVTLGKLKVELGLDARIIDFEAKVSGTAPGGLSISQSESFTVAVPMVYVGIIVNPIKALSIEAEGLGIAYNSNHYYDLIGRVKIKPIGPVFIGGGYRYEDFKMDEQDVNASLKFQGPFLEAGIQL